MLFSPEPAILPHRKVIDHPAYVPRSLPAVEKEKHCIYSVNIATKNQNSSVFSVKTQPELFKILVCSKCQVCIFTQNPIYMCIHTYIRTGMHTYIQLVRSGFGRQQETRERPLSSHNKLKPFWQKHTTGFLVANFETTAGRQTVRGKLDFQGPEQSS